MKRPILALISLYRRYLSGLKRAPCCRFYPSCSGYTYKAVNEWGAVIGLILGLFRILRCQPLCKGGYDPVPRKRRKTVPKSFGYISSDRFGRILLAQSRLFYTDPPYEL